MALNPTPGVTLNQGVISVGESKCCGISNMFWLAFNCRIAVIWGNQLSSYFTMLLGKIRKRKFNSTNKLMPGN